MTLKKDNPTKEQLKRARRVALVLATSTVISLSFMVFAIVQQMEADKQQQLLEESIKKAFELEKAAEMANQEANQARQQAQLYSAELARTLSECAKTKK